MTLRARGPRSLHLVFGCVSLMLPVGPYEAAPVQDPERLLNGTLGETGLLGDLAVAQLYRLPAFADRPAPQEQVHNKGRGTVVMAHQILKQHIRSVLVEAEVSHGGL